MTADVTGDVRLSRSVMTLMRCGLLVTLLNDNRRCVSAGNENTRAPCPSPGGAPHMKWVMAF